MRSNHPFVALKLERCDTSPVSSPSPQYTGQKSPPPGASMRSISRAPCRARAPFGSVRQVRANRLSLAILIENPLDARAEVFGHAVAVYVDHDVRPARLRRQEELDEIVHVGSSRATGNLRHARVTERVEDFLDTFGVPHDLRPRIILMSEPQVHA